MKHVLSSIPLHTLAVFKIPTQVTDMIDHKLQNFLWGYRNGKKLHHWVRWDLCTQPLNEMGLGIRTLGDVYLLFRIKNCWKFLLKNSL